MGTMAFVMSEMSDKHSVWPTAAISVFELLPVMTIWGLVVRAMLSQHDTYIIYTSCIHKTLHQQPTSSLLQIYNPLAQKASQT